ncbi:transposase, partial [Candidatus Poribacteria bacterium]|nr:transposase [Candidatus Poribacteria bacterium]
RLSRVVLPGYPHHITQRGVRSMRIFRSKKDREEYLRLLSEQGKRFGVSFVAYCLMTNHVHLIAVPEESDSLARGIGEAHRLYTRSVNFKQDVRGYLLQGRFYSCPLDNRHLVAAIRYVERNPVRAQMVEHAWDYPWSSAAFRVGLRTQDALVKETDPFELGLDWRALLQSDPEEMNLLKERLRTGRPCGDADFVEKAEELTGRWLKPRHAGRPKKKKK